MPCRPELLASVIAQMIDFYVTRGARRTLAHFHLALSACRSPELNAFAAGAYENEIELLRQCAKEFGVTLGRNLAQLIKSLVGGIVLLRMLDGAGSSPGG